MYLKENCHHLLALILCSTEQEKKMKCRFLAHAITMGRDWSFQASNRMQNTIKYHKSAVVQDFWSQTIVWEH